MQPAGALNPTDWQPQKLAVVAAWAAKEAKILGSSSWALVEVNKETIEHRHHQDIIIVIRHTQQEQLPNDAENVVSTWDIIEPTRYNYETLKAAQNSAWIKSPVKWNFIPTHSQRDFQIKDSSYT